MKINDVIIHKIKWKNDVLTIVKETAPLLRRFGQCDLIMLGMDQNKEVQRQKADELWAVIEGGVKFELEDTRPDSPSFQAKDVVELLGVEDEEGTTQEVILLPFGVACRISTTLPMSAILLRLTTHQDDTNPSDKIP